MRGCPLILALLLLAWSALPAGASPFDTDQPAPYQAAAPAAPPGLLTPARVWLQQVQRDAAQALGQALNGLRDDGAAGSEGTAGERRGGERRGGERRGGIPPIGPLLWALGLAFAYGCFHAAGPGHGKAVVVSYFLSRDARVGQGLLLGLRISIAHVGAAILLVLVLRLILGQAMTSSVEDLRPVKLVAYAAMIGIGVYLLTDALRRWRTGQPAAACCDHGHHGAHHSHDHHHHHHDHDHAGHDHGPADGALNRWRERIIGLLVGAVPCTGAILVLLFALANGMWLAGLAMVAAIGIGMAVTMGALGLAAILARRRLARWAGTPDRQGRLGLLLNLGGPSFVIGLGALLFAGSY